MPFTTIKTEELIHEKKQKDKVFAKQWDESRNEYKLIQEMIKIRKEQHITQTQLAKMTGNKQYSLHFQKASQHQHQEFQIRNEESPHEEPSCH